MMSQNRLDRKQAQGNDQRNQVHSIHGVYHLQS
jgi:hypothetical protein